MGIVYPEGRVLWLFLHLRQRANSSFVFGITTGPGAMEFEERVNTWLEF
jgi:hypothetical protein